MSDIKTKQDWLDEFKRYIKPEDDDFFLIRKISEMLDKVMEDIPEECEYQDRDGGWCGDEYMKVETIENHKTKFLNKYYNKDR